MSSGGGHAPLQESMATLGVPTMTKRSFIAAEKRIGEWWSTLLEDSMRQAGQEERQIAISKNRSCLGDPVITIILDGGGVNVPLNTYNVKSGVGVIIGLETQKILFMGVRNKYCSICSHTDDPPPHTCYKNWDGSSSAMESSIIAEGFQKCIEQHGVEYSKFIGDSVWSTLVSAVPWGFAIEKVECANHSVKCFRTQLENLVSNNPSYKGRGKLTEEM